MKGLRFDLILSSYSFSGYVCSMAGSLPRALAGNVSWDVATIHPLLCMYCTYMQFLLFSCIPGDMCSTEMSQTLQSIELKKCSVRKKYLLGWDVRAWLSNKLKFFWWFVYLHRRPLGIFMWHNGKRGGGGWVGKVWWREGGRADRISRGCTQRDQEPWWLSIMTGK